VWNFNWGVFWSVLAAILAALAVRAVWVTVWGTISEVLFPTPFMMFRRINDHLSVIRDNLPK